MLATYFHGLGRGIWYGLDWPNDHELKDTIALDPEWLSQAYMQVIKHEGTQRAGGMLDHKQLEDVWQDHSDKRWIEYEHHEFSRLISIMREQRVVLPTPPSDGKLSLVPELLPEKPPELPWQSADDLPPKSTLYQIETKLTPGIDGIMPQLIALLEPFHHYPPDSQSGVFWSNGLYIRSREDNFNEALIRFQQEISHATLSVVVTGTNAQWLWSQIDQAINTLKEFWPALERTNRIFCTSRKNGSFCSGSFEYDDVVTASRDEEDPTLKCLKCREKRNAQEILAGLFRLKESAIEAHTAYLFNRENRPAPSSVIIMSLTNKETWGDIRNYEVLGHKKLKAQLRSEYSGVVVAEEVFEAKSGVFKYLKPALKMGSLFLSGTTLPLDLPPDFEETLKDMADAVDRLESNLPDSEKIDDNKPNLYSLRKFLNAVGLDPEAHGMKLGQVSNKWYWMTQEEYQRYSRTRAQLP